MTTVVGTSSAGFSGDGGLATAAKISAPRGVNFDAAGDMLVADGGNARIRKVDPSGIITTVAGGATTVCSIATDTLGDSCPSTLATLALPFQGITDSAGNLYITEFTNSRVRAVNVQASLIPFGNQVINSTSATSLVMVSNTGTAALTLAGLSISGTGFAIVASGGTDCTSSTSLAAGASCSIGVQFCADGGSSGYRVDCCYGQYGRCCGIDADDCVDGYGHTGDTYGFCWSEPCFPQATDRRLRLPRR